MAVKNKVQLITYPDSLGGNLKTLNSVLNKYFPNTFKGGMSSMRCWRPMGAV